MNGSTVSQVSKVNGLVKMRGMESSYFKNLCITELKKMKRAYQSLAENVRGKNEPFPVYLLFLLLIYFSSNFIRN